MIKLDVKDSKGSDRENFNSLQKAWNANPVTNGEWLLVDKTMTTGTHTQTHRLGFKPLDVIVMHQSGGGTVAFHYDDFTDTTYTFTVATAETRFRVLLGKAA